MGGWRNGIWEQWAGGNQLTELVLSWSDGKATEAGGAMVQRMRPEKQQVLIGEKT